MQNIKPIPKNAPALPTVKQIKIGEKYIEKPIELIWTYKDFEGKPLFYTVRADYRLEDGKKCKDIVPLSLWKSDDSLNLRWKFKRPEYVKFPLFNLHFLHSFPEATVVLVEGEKCADLAQCLFFNAKQYKIIFLSTFAGTNNVQLADLSVLSKRKIFLFPDNDNVGLEAMNYIGNNIIDPLSINIVNLNKEKPEGWDVADAILDEKWDFKQVFEYIKNNNIEFKKQKYIPPPLPKPTIQNITTTETAETILAPFRPLGVFEGKIYFLLKETHETISISERRICHKDELICLAPINYWEKNYPGKTSPNWEQAGDSILRIARKLGIFDITQLRGRGVWYEGNNIIINLGNKLLINNEVKTIFAHKSDYIYSVRPRIEVKKCVPLTNTEANQYLDLCKMLCWNKPIYGTYQAGWVTLATVCGAWSWRPNIWITAEHGAGKSYNIKNIIAPILGKWGIGLVGNVTEPGIRQLLNSDSLSIFFDESEGETAKGQERLQSILEMIRHSTDEGKMKMVKGSAEGTAKLYDIRSMFLLSSIGVNMTKGADISRITLLKLLKNKSDNARAHFEQLDSMVLRLLTEEYCERMRERIRRMIPTIKCSYEIFRKLIAEKTGIQRTGDQVGMLLSGAYSLTSTSAITSEKALEWINNTDWGEKTDFIVDKDSETCLNHILEFQITYGGSIHSLGELIYKAYIDGDEMQEVLSNYGIKVRDSYVCFCAKHSILGKKVLANTAWVNCYDLVLERMEDTERTRLSFSGYKRACICIPIKKIID